MGTIHTKAPTADPYYQAGGHDLIPSGWATGTAAIDSLLLAGGSSVLRFIEQQEASVGEPPTIPTFGAMRREQINQLYRDRGMQSTWDAGNTVPLLTPEEANARFGLNGNLQFDAPIRETEAELLYDWKVGELQRTDVLRRAERGFLPGATRFAAGFAVQILDPVNVASLFIPVVAEARMAIWTARYGTTAARLTRGALEGFTGSALTEPIVYAQQVAQQGNYDELDLLLNLTFGTVLGGGLHVGLGKLSDVLAARRPAPIAASIAAKVEALPLRERESLLRGAVAALAEGRPVQIDELFDALPRRERLLSGTTIGGPERPAIEFDPRTELEPRGEPVTTPSEPLTVAVVTARGEPLIARTEAQARRKAEGREGAFVVRTDDGRFAVRQKLEGDLVRRPDGSPVVVKTERAAARLTRDLERQGRKAEPVPITLPGDRRVKWSLIEGGRASDAAALRASPVSIGIPERRNTRQPGPLVSVENPGRTVARAAQSTARKADPALPAADDARTIAAVDEKLAARKASDDPVAELEELIEEDLRRAGPDIKDEPSMKAAEESLRKADQAAKLYEQAAVCLTKGG